VRAAGRVGTPERISARDGYLPPDYYLLYYLQSKADR
jgi:hypothetical protein